MDNEIKKVYFTIGEVAEMIDVATSAIRFWETEFSWTMPRWDRKGHRQYSRAQVNEVLKVHFLMKKCGKTTLGLVEARAFGFYENLINSYEGYYGSTCKQLPNAKT